MRSIIKTKILYFLLIGIAALVTLAIPTVAHAAPLTNFAATKTSLCPPGSASSTDNSTQLCGGCATPGVANSCATCSTGGVDCGDPAATTCSNTSKCDLITTYLNPFIRILSISVGVIAAASLILGGIQYSSSEGDPQKVSAAKNRLTKTIFAIVAYVFLYAFLQFLVPGGFGK